MVLSRAAIRYAKATLSLAIGQKAEDAVMLNMKELSHGISDNPEIKEMLLSPMVKSDQKLNFLNEYLSTAHETTKGLLRTLHENGRIELLEEVALQYLILHKKHKNEDTAYVTTAVPLSESLRIQVLDKIKEFTDKEIHLENQVNSELIGGFVLRIGDIQYDASIARKLDRMKREFTNSL